MENTRISTRHGFVFAFLVACFVAFALAMSMTSTAEASTKAPYAGYKSGGNYLNAGSISMSTYDARKVKDGYESFTVWSGNSKAYNDKGQYVAAKKTFKKLKGMKYNKKTNTLTLKNVKAPKYTLYLNGMGTGFKIKVKGNNSLAGIYSNAASKYASNGTYTGKYYPSSVRIDGTGKLVLNKNKYNSSAISIYGSNSHSTLTITKKPTVKMWAYGTGDVINVYSTTVSKDTSAVKIKGNVSDALYKASVKVPGYKSYKSESVSILNSSNAYKTTAYSKSGKLYRVSDYLSDSYVLERLDKIGSTSYYAPSGKTLTVSSLPSSTKSIKLVYGNTSYLTKLNKGAYYGETAGDSYYDTKTRQSYNTKWNVYKKVAKVNGTTYVSLAKKNVKNNKNLPKGYKGSVDTKYSTTYSYVVKNSKLVAAR